MASATFDNIPIPLVYSVEVGREFKGERARTAAGNIRQDTIAIKRTWQLQTKALTPADAATLTDYLDSTGFAPGDFWLDDFGLGATVKAIIPAESLKENHVVITRNGTTYPNARELSFTVMEV